MNKLEKGRNKILLLFLHTHPQEVLLDLLLPTGCNKTTIPIPHTTFYTRRKTQCFFFFFTEHLLQIPNSAAAAAADVSLFLSSKSMMRARHWDQRKSVCTLVASCLL
jgi:hypothetical protein